MLKRGATMTVICIKPPKPIRKILRFILHK